jgi:hypothetical protein
MKNTIIIITLLFSSLIAAEENPKRTLSTDENISVSIPQIAPELWQKQEAYLAELTHLKKSINALLQDFNLCRTTSVNATNSLISGKEFYNANKKFSVELLSTSMILERAVLEMNNSMTNDKSTVMQNLSEFSEILDEALAAEKKRNNTLFANFESRMDNIKARFCKSANTSYDNKNIMTTKEG